MRDDRIAEYYRSTWGPPAREADFTSRDFEVEIGKWDAAATGQGVTIYATNGVAARTTDASHADELLLGITPEYDDGVRALADLAAEVGRNGKPVEHGNAWRFEEPLWPGTSMDSFVALRQSRVLAPLVLPSGVHVEFKQVVPVYRNEVELSIAHGIAALLQRWKELGVPFWTVERPEVRV